jgi:hypothetical protein
MTTRANRSMRADYFPFYVHNGKRFAAMFDEFGHVGCLCWIILLQQLATTKYHYFRLDETIELKMLARECRVSDEEFTKILDFMADLKIIDRVLWVKHKIIWNQELVDSLESLYKKRTADIPTVEIICKINDIDLTDIDLSVRLSSFEEDKSIQRKEGRKEVSKKGRNGESSDSSTTHPSLETVTKYFLENDYSEDLAKKAFDTYAPSWLDTHGNRIKNWKMKMQKVWFKTTEYQPKAHTPTGSTQVLPKRPSK